MDVDLRDLELLEALDQPRDPDRRRPHLYVEPARAQPTPDAARGAPRRRPCSNDRGRRLVANRRRYPDAARRAASPCGELASRAGATCSEIARQPRRPCASATQCSHELPLAARRSCARSVSCDPSTEVTHRTCRRRDRSSALSSTARSTSRSSTSSNGRPRPSAPARLFDDELLVVVAAEPSVGDRALRRRRRLHRRPPRAVRQLRPTACPPVPLPDPGRRPPAAR